MECSLKAITPLGTFESAYCDIESGDLEAMRQLLSKPKGIAHLKIEDPTCGDVYLGHGTIANSVFIIQTIR